ncbi:MAG: glycosyltransferase family 4 protein [Sulfurospirillaceae bacterium]|nr:glycosyltransferase family 4 protein [Sulfurospirillaceae bacterium]MDD2826357.1 glycosyltransferase family 4 protein [Sulfurospirillaceae bacterium]
MILLIGPIFPPIHGQSLAFTRFVESINEDKRILINTNLENKSKIGKIFATFKTLLSISMKVIFSKYDIVYFTCSRSILGSIKDILLINLVSLKDVNIVNHLHGSDFKEFLDTSPKWYQKILIKSYTKVDISIVLLDSMKEQFVDFPEMNVEIVPNFYDKELNEKLEEKDDDKINLVYFSNIMSSKGIFELIDAFEILSKEYDNIYLNIAGEYIADEYMSIDEVKEKFQNKIYHHDRIKYVGKIFGERKARVLQKSDIFVLPSYYKSEAFPISIIEAMACKNAIVTTNYKYLPAVVFSENGMIVETKSVDSLVDGIKNLIIDKEKLKQIQIYNHQVAKEKYSLEQYIDNLNRIVMKK